MLRNVSKNDVSRTRTEDVKNWNEYFQDTRINSRLNQNCFERLSTPIHFLIHTVTERNTPESEPRNRSLPHNTIHRNKSNEYQLRRVFFRSWAILAVHIAESSYDYNVLLFPRYCTENSNAMLQWNRQLLNRPEVPSQLRHWSTAKWILTCITYDS